MDQPGNRLPPIPEGCIHPELLNPFGSVQLYGGKHDGMFASAVIHANMERRILIPWLAYAAPHRGGSTWVLRVRDALFNAPGLIERHHWGLLWCELEEAGFTPYVRMMDIQRQRMSYQYLERGEFVDFCSTVYK